MATMSVRTEADRQKALRVIRNAPLGFLLTKTKGEKRSDAQNRLQRLWCNELEEQGDQTAEEYRAYIKLVFGVPILRAQNESFREQYDTHVRGLPYETKLALMMEPIDFPVTRLMSVKQKRQFLDTVYNKFTEHGFVLTNPSWAGMDVI